MKTIHITEAFDGYPQGSKEGSKRVTFAVGSEPEVSNEFADLIVGKGLAREVGSKAPPAKAAAEQEAVK